MTAVLTHRYARCRRFIAVLLAPLTFGVLIAGAPAAYAAQAQVGLGTAASFAVLGGSTVTNTGTSVISGSVGVSPGSAVTGFPPGTVSNGVIHKADGVAGQAQQDLTTAYNDAAGRTPSSSVSGDLVGRTLVPGVYKSTSTLGLTGTVTLDAKGDPQAVFIFQIAKTLITGSNSRVALIGGAQACNVFWQVGSSATLGTGTTFRGNILALTSITATTGATIEGRALARNGAVTLDTNTITRPSCATVATSTTITSSTTSPTPGQPVTMTATTTALTGTATPTGVVEFKNGSTVLGTVTVNDSGKAVWTTTNLSVAGWSTVTASYLGAPGFGTSTSAPITETVTPLGTMAPPPASPATTTTVTAHHGGHRLPSTHPTSSAATSARLAQTGASPLIPAAGAAALLLGGVLLAYNGRARRN